MGLSESRRGVVRTEDGLLFEAEVPPGAWTRSVEGRGVLAAAGMNVEDVMRMAGEPIARGIQVMTDSMAGSRPSRISAQFGLMLTAEAGAVLSKGLDNCHIAVTLEWSPTE
jgi:hypothetical protein